MIKYKKNEILILILLILFFVGYFGLFSLLYNYISKTLIYLILLFVWIIATRKCIKHGIKNFKKEYFNEALSIVIVILIVSSLLFILSNMQIKESSSQEKISVMIFSSLIFAPIVEELINRYALGLFLEKVIKNDNLINIITASIFSFLHVFKMKLDIVGLFVYGIIYWLLGYACGYYYRKNDNILISIVIHFIWNLFMITGAIIRIILSFF